MNEKLQEFVELYLKGEEDINNLPPLIDRYIYYICRSYTNIAPLEDLYQISWIAIIKALSSYKIESKIKFISYVKTCIVNELLMFSRINNKAFRSGYSVISIDESINSVNDKLRIEDILCDDHDLESDIVYSNLSNQIEVLYNKFLRTRSKRVREVINLRDEGCNQLIISKKLGLSQSYISRIIGKFNKQWREYVLIKFPEIKEIYIDNKRSV